MTGKSAIIIVDVQNDFVEGGKLAIKGGLDVASQVAQLVKYEASDVLVTTQDWHIDPTEHLEEWGEHCMANTEGAELVDILKDAINEVKDHLPYFAVKKGMHNSGYSGFSDAYFPSQSGLTKWLKRHGVTHVFIAGLATDYCVQATAIDAVKAGFVTDIYLGMVAGTSQEGSKAAYEAMQNVGVNIHDISK